MSLFLSTFINKIDSKGRVSLPASFRTSLTPSSQEGFVLFKSYTHPALEGCSYQRMKHLSDSMDGLDLFSEVQDNLAATIFADAAFLSWDQEGRTLIPQDLLRYANLSDQVAFVGRGSTFQVWNPTAFKAYQEKARAHIKTNGVTLKLNPREV